MPRQPVHREGDQIVVAPCPLCGSESVEEIWRNASGIANGICSRCGHVHLHSRLADEAIAASYAEYGQRYPEVYLLDEGNLLFEVARSRIDFLRQHLPGFPPGAILEVGCGYGHFLRLLQGVSECYGIEPSREQAVFAQKMFGLRNVIRGDFESAEDSEVLSSRTFDVVCSFHVMEHLVDPIHFLEFVRRRLRRGALVCVAVPDLNTLSPDLIELYFISRSWHLHSFSRSTMSRLLQSQGFSLVAVRQEGTTPMLRSSTIFLARYDDRPVDSPVDEGVLVDSREAAMRFHGELDRRVKAIRRAFLNWRAKDQRVAVYGGGIHTRALLSLTGVTCDEVAVIIDDDPAKKGTTVFGVPVLPLETALAEGIDVIVVSSLASEDDILVRLEENGIAERVTVKGIYRDLCCQTGKE